MAIINENFSDISSDIVQISEIKFTCPVCKAVKVLEFPNSVINEAKQLSTISIPKGLICEHHFQAFVDKNFMVRGYQKVDYEFKFESSHNYNSVKKELNTNDQELFETLILEGNYVKYTPKEGKKREISTKLDISGMEKERKQYLTLKKIYEEFWEFIADDNLEFKQFIKNDPRRKK